MNRPRRENQNEPRRHRPTSINVANESKDSTNDESKLDYEFANLELGEGTTSTTRKARSSTLRRRRYRRGLTSSVESDPNEERKRGDDSYSPRDKPGVRQQESKEDEHDVVPTSSNARPPRHSSSSSLLPHTVNDTVTNTNKAAEEERKAHAPPPSRTSLPIMHASSNYRAKPDEKLREKFKKRIRSPADMIPEVHFIGEVAEGIGFKDTYVSCKWYLEWGKSWSFLAGDESSQTQYAASDDDGVQVFNHPIDVHFATASMQGWPRIVVQVWELDEYGRSILSGYGFTHLPTSPGYHELEVRCWRPSGSLREELQSFFLGTSSCLVDEKVIFGKAWEARQNLTTVSSGIVKLNIHVLLRFFKEQNVA